MTARDVVVRLRRDAVARREAARRALDAALLRELLARRVLCRVGADVADPASAQQRRARSRYFCALDRRTHWRRRLDVQAVTVRTLGAALATMHAQGVR